MRIKTVALCLLISIFLTCHAPTVATAQELVQTSLRVGYLFPNRPVSLTLDSINEPYSVYGGEPGFPLRDLKQTAHLRGVWTELDARVRGFGPLAIQLGVSYLLSPAESEETYHFSSTTGSSLTPGERSWNTNNQLWHLEAAVAYAISPWVSTSLGFRYESLLINFQKPYDQQDPRALFGPTDRADLSFSGYIPFLGVRVERNVRYNSLVKAGVMGFPALPSGLDYKESMGRLGSSVGSIQTQAGRIEASNGFPGGYFLEAFADLSLEMYGVQLGCFVKYSGMYGKRRVDVNSLISRVPVPDPQNPKQTILVTKSFHNDVNAVFETSSWIVGGSVSFNFWL